MFGRHFKYVVGIKKSLVKRDTKVEICCWIERETPKLKYAVGLKVWSRETPKLKYVVGLKSWSRETLKLKYVVGLKVWWRETPKLKYAAGMKVWPRATHILDAPWQSLMSVPLKLILEGKGSLVYTFLGDIKVISVFGLHLTVAYCLSSSPSSPGPQTDGHSDSSRHLDFVTEL